MNDQHTDGDGGYWPGYVDAIVNVILNVVFVVGMLAAMVSSIDMQPPAIAEQKMFKRPSFSLPQEQQHPAPERLIVTKLQGAIEPGKDSSDYVVSGTDDVVKVIFADASIEFNINSTQAFREALRRLSYDAEAGRWIVWTTADSRRDVSARLAYLRLIGVRNALLREGISPNAIQVRLLQSSPDQDVAGSQVLIARIPERSEPMPHALPVWPAASTETDKH